MRMLNQHEANAVKHVLMAGKLIHPVPISFQEFKLRADFVSATNAASSRHFPLYDMTERQLLGPDGQKPLQIKDTASGVFINIGEWAYDTRLKDVHITLGTTRRSNLNQVELSTCLTDGEAIFLTKNISALAGEGAITSLNRGTTNKAVKWDRRKRLVELIKNETIMFEGVEHLVVSSIDYSDLMAKKSTDSIFTNLVKDLFQYAFAVETLAISNHLPINKIEKTKGGFRIQLSAAERKRIEMAAEDFAVKKYEGEGYMVTRRSEVRGIGYDLEVQKQGMTLRVEVKGTTLGDWTITLTRNEHDAAQRHRGDFVLFVVELDNVENAKVVRHTAIPNPLHAGLTVMPETYSVCRARRRN